MFPYNSAAPYQQYNGMGASPLKLSLSPAFLPCIQEQQAKLGRKLTSEEVQACLKGGTGIPLWVWIAGGAVLAGAGYWFFVR